MAELLSSRFEIYIRGNLLDYERKALIEDITIDEIANGSTMLHIKIRDPEMLFIEDNIFIEDVSIAFRGEILNKEGKVVKKDNFDGYISVIDIDFPENGVPSLTIHCMDNTYLMNRVKKSRTWKNKKDSEIAQEIFKEYGFTMEVTSTKERHETISQSNETDIEFLIKRANDQDEPFFVFVEGKRGYFVWRNMLQKPMENLEYRKGNGYLLSFNPIINKEIVKEKVKKSNVNVKDKKVEKAEVKESNQIQGKSVKTSSSKINNTAHEYKGGGKWNTKKN